LGHAARTRWPIFFSPALEVTMSEETKPKTGFQPGPNPKGGRRKGSKALTPAEKAEAVALWRSGNVTLADLEKKFKRRPETFSRLFKAMDVKKGEAAAEVQEKIAQKVEARMLNDAEETASRIAKAKDEHYRMSSGIAKLAWSEIAKAKAENRPLSTALETMKTLQLAASTISKSREEVWKILQIDKFDEDDEDGSLPELVIRELTTDEVKGMQSAAAPGDDMDIEGGAAVIDFPEVSE
jgi:hypothetical protein